MVLICIFLLISESDSGSTTSDASSTNKTQRKVSTDEVKDERYWHFRRQNNMAAKQSRNAHKAKMDQIAKQAIILEKKNKKLSEEISLIKSDTLNLKEILRQYEPVI